MASVLLFHHIQGLTDGVVAFADDLRAAGHRVETPDLFEGRVFGSLEEGFGYAREVGLEAVRDRGRHAADAAAGPVVYAGFSFGVTIAQELAQTRPAAGALLLYSCMPVAEYSEAWPAGVPVQIHGKEGDEFFDEDLPAARELASAVADAELFVYPGTQHLFADSSLPDFDPDAAGLMTERVLAFLARL
ncbi:dienelactone hydrolase family protein [Demequina sp. NBRC 110057]|uniref:dienelactone hydrolase family protein n=1 Tax=Demequina sp. NBRC 110057 TaxID=1570346 RepID=UPI0009FD9455|nr:dienelactone hydrolase family protein [Demequina sp. NBRC 110057]